ncbi:MAG: sterol desaturase family protein [Saprospiraceae bacterium]|nr:sterol desaturase family protein [Saprospiraceae bacterium]
MNPIIIILITFLTMEGVTWFVHKYVMHGFLWVLHSDHHKKDHHHVLERNDSFFLFFGIPGFLLCLFGAQVGTAAPYLWIGLGVTLYGFAYLMVHDIFIHQRLKIFRKTKIPYLLALRRAHKMHHKHLGKEEGECFGMLWVPIKYFREALNAGKT